MAYQLGIDLGTSCTVAAVSRTNGGVEIVALRVGTPGVPTVLHLADDGTMLVGAAAEPLMLNDPGRVFRGFLHRLDEPSWPDPLRSPATLTARLVHWIVEAVTEQEGGPPQQITLAHPAGWGVDECGVLQNALIQFGLAGVVLMPTSLAAAAAYAAEVGVTGAGLAAGDVLAVYDLGATFSVSLLRRASDDLAVLGQPQVLADGGGARFDELVLARVLDELGDQVAAADLDDQVMLAGMAALLADCVTARETLTTRSEVSIPVSLPGLEAQVRLTGDELEKLVAPTLRASVHSVRAAISVAGLRPGDVSKVLVTGGCAGMPAVARLLGTELRRPLVVLTEPELAAARGAALLAARPGHSEPVVVQPPPIPAVPDDPADDLRAAPLPALTSPVLPIPVLPVPRDRLWAETRPEPASVHAAADTVPLPRIPSPSRRVPVSVARVPPPSPPVPAGELAAERPFRPRRRVLLAVAAGIISVTTIILPLTLWRAPDSGAASSTVTDRDPRRDEAAPVYEGITMPSARAGIPSTTIADLPTSPARLLARRPTASQPVPQPLASRPSLPGTSSPPDPSTTTTSNPSTTTTPSSPDPTTTTSSTPPSSSTPTTTSSTTSPPSSSSTVPSSGVPTPPP
ncbi:MAG: Hsp70 family protein [Pseudonocardiaceae bacterium]